MQESDEMEEFAALVYARSLRLEYPRVLHEDLLCLYYCMGVTKMVCMEKDL